MNEKYFDNYLTSYLLATIGGFLDIYTYLLKGHVFANAQTGNLVLLANSLTEFDYNSTITYLSPVIAFGAGIFLSNMIRHQLIPLIKINFHFMVILIELAVFVSLLAIRLDDLIFNSIIGFTCALQVSSFASTKNLPYASTMCTGNLRLMANNLYYGFVKKNPEYIHNGLFYLKIIISFVIGAMVAVILIDWLGPIALTYCIFILVAIIAINFLMLKRLE
ncbi:MAG: YoaK family protein [Erysipelotrichaceae bacterium]|nr:YoaK family protein [Erysipelotrichaceae bacterium]MDD3810423.1 YoaK family protein [Erysipelotrichaceae bacterium]